MEAKLRTTFWAPWFSSDGTLSALQLSWCRGPHVIPDSALPRLSIQQALLTCISNNQEL